MYRQVLRLGGLSRPSTSSSLDLKKFISIFGCHENFLSQALFPKYSYSNSPLSLKKYLLSLYLKTLLVYVRSSSSNSVFLDFSLFFISITFLRLRRPGFSLTFFLSIGVWNLITAIFPYSRLSNFGTERLLNQKLGLRRPQNLFKVIFGMYLTARLMSDISAMVVGTMSHLACRLLHTFVELCVMNT